MKTDFIRGLRAGIPVGLGYLSVSFSFGIIAVSLGFSWWQALLISMTTVTSAGQFAALGQMLLPGQHLALLISQLTINLRYFFMSVALSQKTDKNFSLPKRALLGFMMTDEIFAIASGEKEVSAAFFAGTALLPYFGWSGGTLLGALAGNVLPDKVLDALGIAIYGMFIAIVVPPAKKYPRVRFAVALAAALSCLFAFVPALGNVPQGITVSLCAAAAAGVCAAFFPVEDENG